MKEFIDKLIERLEEESSQSLKDMIASKSNAGENFNSGMAGAFNKTIAIVNQLAEEYKVSEMPTGSEDFCEWKKGKSSVFPIKTNCGNSIDVNYGYEFCPYCGKKIKVAPYTEGE